jgi:hypothetical protein
MNLITKLKKKLEAICTSRGMVEVAVRQGKAVDLHN